MAVITKRSPAPLYAAAVVWVLWAIFAPMYTLLHFALVTALSLAVYFIARCIWPGKVITVPDPQPEPAPAPTLTPEIAQLVADRDLALSEMRRLNDSIQDETISAQIDHLEEVAEKTINHVVAYPEKLPQLRKFLNYYLPTTLKLLNAYDRMDAVGISGSNIDGTKGKIEDMMTSVVQAFDKQLDGLFGDEAMDISTDITVMEQMLAREGIGGLQIEQ